MSTRGLIAIEAADRSCRSIYVHFDLYPSGAGVCLTAHYNTKERIEALFALGDLSGLGGRLSNGDPEPDAQDVCHAYHRDYGEKLCPPRVWADADEMLARAADAYWAEYVYLFRNGNFQDAERACRRGVLSDQLRPASKSARDREGLLGVL